MAIRKPTTRDISQAYTAQQSNRTGQVLGSANFTKGLNSGLSDAQVAQMHMNQTGDPTGANAPGQTIDYSPEHLAKLRSDPLYRGDPNGADQVTPGQSNQMGLVDPNTFQPIPGGGVENYSSVGGFNDPTAKEAAAHRQSEDARIAAAVGYKKIVDQYGNESYVKDAGATANAQNDMRKQIAAEKAAGAAAQNAGTNAANNNKETMGSTAMGPQTQDQFLASLGQQSPTGGTSAPPPSPTPPISSAMHGGLPPEQQTAMQQLMAPFDQYQADVQGKLDTQKSDAQAANKTVADNLKTYFDKAQASATAYSTNSQGILSTINANQLQNAKLSYQNERSNENLAYQQAQIQYNQAARKQEIQNEEDRKVWMDGLGISGAWRSSRASADVIRQLNKGEQLVANIREDQAFGTVAHGEHLNQIENTFTSNQNTANTAYQQGILQLNQQVHQEAKELLSTVFTSSQEQIKANTELNQHYIDGYSAIASGRAQASMANNKWLIDNARNARTEIRENVNQLLSQYDKKVTSKGDNIGEDFRSIEKQLSALGYDTTGMSTPFTSVSQYSAYRLQNLYDQFPAGGSPNGSGGGSYNDDIISVASRLTGDTAKSFLMNAHRLQSSGSKQALDDAINTAAITTLDPQTKHTYDSNLITLQQLQRNIDTLNSDSEFSKYKTIEQNKMAPYFNSQQDQPWVKAVANIQYFANKVGHDLYGGAFTTGEADRLRTQMPDFNGDSIATIRTKLNTYYDNLTADIQTTLKMARQGNGVIPSKSVTEQGQMSPDDVLKQFKQSQGIGGSSSSSSSHGPLSWTSSFIPKAEAADYPSYGSYANKNEQDLPSSLSLQLSPHSVDEWVSALNSTETQGYNTPINYNIPGARKRTGGGEFHDGLDIATLDGSKPDIPAFVGGRVYAIQKETESGGWGNTITIRDNAGNLHKYSHLDSIPASLYENASVEPGTVIGKMGNTGHVFSAHGGDGSHLDYRILGTDGKFKDPRAFEHNAIAFSNR